MKKDVTKDTGEPKKEDAVRDLDAAADPKGGWTLSEVFIDSVVAPPRPKTNSTR